MTQAYGKQELERLRKIAAERDPGLLDVIETIRQVKDHTGKPGDGQTRRLRMPYANPAPLDERRWKK